MRKSLLLSAAFLATTLSVAQAPQVAVDPQIQKFSTLLGVDLEKLAISLAHLKYAVQDQDNHGTVQSIKLSAEQANFSSAEGKKDDYLLHMDVETGWKDHTTVILVFVSDNKSYRRVFDLELGNKGFADRAKLIDVDSDNRMEILLETDRSGNQSTDVEMTIWRFENGRFKAIFEQTLDKWYMGTYSVHNQYRFVPHPANAKLKDIEFVVSTAYDDSRLGPEARKEAKEIHPPTPVSEKYRFTFDGVKYAADRPVYDYKAFFQEEGRYYRDLYPDTWVASDAPGRSMPDYAEVGPVKTDQRRVVGIFYITWHSDSLAGMKSPYTADVSKVLAGDPNARLDAKNPLWTEGSYHWGEPEAGYFLSKDEYVIRKDMSMLADAGVDVLVMDVTNAVRYWDEWDVVFPVMQKMKAESNKAPQFCFWAFNGPAITVVQDLYDRIYKTEKYKDLWFYWDGKPLLLYNGTPNVDSNGQVGQHPNPHYDPAAKTDTKNPHYGDPDYTEEFYKDYTKEVKDFFTLRTMWWGYYEWAGKRFIGTEDNWSFGYDMGDDRVKAMSPDDLISKHNGAKEEAAVTPAQHPSSLTGKSWTREHGEPELNEYDLPVPTYVPWLGKTVEHPEGYGIYFQERWDEAIKANPQFLYINDWNEWTAGKYQPEAGHTFPFMRREGTYRFIDQYNSEFNRCLHPMKDGYTDNYYMQMAQNIRRYKGIRPIPELNGLSTMTIDGDFADWKTIGVEFRDTVGDTFHRDYKGYGGLQYKNDSGRNDIVTCKVAVDEDNVYFYAETNGPLTPHTGNNWMLLLIDADQNQDTGPQGACNGWYGYDYLVNKKVVDDKTTMLMHYDPNSPGNPWLEQAQLNYRYTGKALELAVPRELIGLKGDAFTFDFHWCDNPADLKDPISLCVNGDSAPNRRFNYRCIWKKST